MKESLFWLLVLLVAQPFRIQVSVVAFLLIAHVDMSGPGFDSAGSVGWANAFKALVLPGWLLLLAVRDASRKRGQRPFRARVQIPNRPMAALWLLFVAYVGIAVLWSPMQLAGLKLLMALASHTLVFLSLLFLWLGGHITRRTILLTLLLTLAIAALQTYAMGNLYGTGERITRPRFTTFSGPQSFAENFATVGAVLVWAPAAGLGGGIMAVSLLLGVSLLTGSRIGFFGGAAGVGLWLARRLDARRIAVGGFLVTGLTLGLMSAPVRGRLVGSRVGEVLEVLRKGGRGIQNVGTFGWRDGLYRCLWDELEGKDSAQLIFGSGTSSIGVAGLVCESYWDPERFSPNRVAHNEFLRALYNWGLVGLLLTLILVALLVRAAWRGYVQAGRGDPSLSWHFGPLASALPLLLLSLSFEALIQGPMSPGSLGFLLVISQAAAAWVRLRGQAEGTPSLAGSS